MLTPYVEPIRGGITTFVSGLSSELRRQGIEVFTISREGAPHENVEVIRGDMGTFARKASALVKRYEPDAIHAHGHWYLLRTALKARVRRSTRIIFSFHTLWSPRGPLRRYLLRSLLLQSDFVTSPTSHLLQTMEWHLPSKLVRIIPPGTEEVILDAGRVAEFRNSLLASGWKRVIGYVGQFEWPGKVRGFRILLEALTTPELAGAGVAVAGGGSLLQSAMEAANEVGVAARVRFLGQVEDPHFLYAACDVYCHPSLQEGLSLAVLEAMRMGVAVVAFRTGFMEEVVSDRQDGLLVESTPKSLARGISELLEDPSLARRLGAEGRRRALADFGWNRAARAFMQLYGVGY